MPGNSAGIKDISGRDIREGDRIRVKHINYMKTEKEYVDEDFIKINLKNIEAKNYGRKGRNSN